MTARIPAERRLEAHKKRILVAIEREQRKERPLKFDIKRRKPRCRPRYYLMGESNALPPR